MRPWAHQQTSRNHHHGTLDSIYSVSPDMRNSPLLFDTCNAFSSGRALLLFEREGCADRQVQFRPSVVVVQPTVRQGIEFHTSINPNVDVHLTSDEVVCTGSTLTSSQNHPKATAMALMDWFPQTARAIDKRARGMMRGCFECMGSIPGGELQSRRRWCQVDGTWTLDGTPSLKFCYNTNC